MRTMCSPILVLPFIFPLACGGGGAAPEGPRSPSAPGSTASSPPDPNAASATDATTTTATLGDGGSGPQGTKLAEAKPGAAASASGAPAPRGPHTHDPGRGPDDIRAIIAARRDEARACYDKGLASHPGIEGDLVIQWTVDPKGNVTQVSVDTSRSQIAEPGVVACVSDMIKKLQFAPSAGGFETKAFYPFNFHPRSSRPAGVP